MLRCSRSSDCSNPTTMSPPFHHQRKHFDYFIEGWLEGQPEEGQFDLGRAPPSFKQRVMSDTPTQPCGSRTPRLPRVTEQETTNFRDNELQRQTRAHNGVKRISRLDGDSVLSPFTEPATSATSASRAPSPSKSVRSRRGSVGLYKPCNTYQYSSGPPGRSYNSGKEILNNR